VPGLRFCDACGAPIGATATSPSAAAPIELRKVVTVLFADLVGSTALQEGMDPESARGVMQRYYTLVGDVIARLGGRVVKFIGDGAMAVFGVPETHEDDARRALAAALALHEEFGGLAAEVSLERGVPIALRVGVNTGEVVVSVADDDVVGDAVNLAARLERAADSGGVLVGESTWRLARGQAAFGEARELHVAGKAEAVRARSLLGLHDTGMELGTELVGRAHEAAVLRRAFDEVVRSGSPQLAVVLGSPGVGKTRLATELGRAVGANSTVLVARCAQQTGAPLAPLAEMLLSALGTTPADPAATTERLAAFLGDGPDPERVLRTVTAIIEAGGGATPEETLWAVRRLIEQRARTEPVLLVVDDLQWAEAMLLDVVEHLAEWTRGPLLLVALARPELRERRGALTDGARHTVLALEGLDHDATVRLACDLLGADALPPALLERLPASTGGNPLFVRELVRMLVDDGVLRAGDGGWELRVAAGAIDVPPTIQALISARLDRLGDDERLVLERASVWGTEFPLGALVTLLPLGAPETDAVLEQLRRKELLERAGSYWVDEPVYRFHHVLIRDAAYRRLLRETRAVLHEQLAGWLEAKTATVEADYDELVGHHLEQAYLHRSQLGGLDDHATAVGRAASARLGAAAQRALDRDDPAAAPLAARALGCLPADDPGRAELLVVRCDALLSAADATAAREAVAELARVASSPRLRAWSECFAAQLATIVDPARLRETEQRAAGVAGELAALGDTRGAARAHAVHAGALARLGRFAEVEEALDRALTAAREAGDRRLATVALAAAPIAAVWGPSPVPRAGGRCLDVVRLLRITAGSPAVEATSLRCQAVLEAFRGRTEAARRLAGAARDMLQELGLVHGLLEVELFAGIVELNAGDLDAADACLSRAYDGLRGLGAGADAARAGALLARVALQRGALADAERLARDAGELAGDDLPAAIVWRRVAAEVLASRGEHDEARRLAEAAVALASETDALVQHADACLGLAAVRRVAGDAAGAAQMAREAADLYERKGATALVQLARTALDAPSATIGAGAPRARPAALRNAATDVFARRAVALTAGDRAGLAALSSDEYVFDDRRAVVGAGRNDAGVMVAATREMMAEGTRSDGETIAVRGERLALIRSSTRTGPEDEHYARDSLLVLEVGPEARARAAVIFDPEDLDAAVEELDRRYIAGEGAPYGRVVAATVEWNAAWDSGDWDTIRAGCSPGAVFTDHRPGSFGAQTVEGLIVTVQQAFAPGSRLTMPIIHEARTDALLFEIVRSGLAPDGSAVEWSCQALIRMGYTGIERADIFPGDALDDARAAFAAITPPRLSNRATAAFTRVAERFAARNWDGLGAALSDGFAYEDHRPVVAARSVGREVVVAGMQLVAEQGADRLTYAVIAVRGERLALLRIGAESHVDREDSFASVMLGVVEVDEEGRLCRNSTHGVHDMEAATAELERRYLAGEAQGARALQVTVELNHAYNARNWDVLATHFAPTCVFVDHRPAAWGAMATVDALTDLLRGLVALVPDGHLTMVSVDALSDDAIAYTTVVTGPSGDTGPVELPGHLVSRLDGRQITRFEIFGPGALDEALAAFHAGSVRTAALKNRSTELRDHQSRLLERQEWDALSELYGDPSYRGEEHRRGIGGMRDISPVDGFRAAARLGLERTSYRALAVRGQWLALEEGRVAGGRDDATGVEVRLLLVTEVGEGGRFRFTAAYDVDDIDAAVAKLEERYIAGEGAPFADMLRLVAVAHGAYGRPDSDGAGFAPDVVYVDHRPLGFGTLHGRGAMAEAIQPILTMVPDARPLMTMVHRLTAASIVYSANIHGHVLDGGNVELPYHIAMRRGPDGIERIETFPGDDLAGALAAERRVSAPVSNRCTGAQDALCELFARRDWDGLAGLFAPGFDGDDHRRAYVSFVTDPVASFGAAADLGTTRMTSRPLATRGERLAVSVWETFQDIPDPAGVECLFLCEVDADGRFVWMSSYDLDALEAATRQLDERYVTSEGSAREDVWRVLCAWRDAFNGRDWEALARLLHPDTRVADHNLHGYEARGADEVRALSEAIIAASPGLVMRFQLIEAIGPHGALVQVLSAPPDTGDVEFGTVFLDLVDVRGGTVRSCDIYPLERLAEARARFATLETGHGALPLLRNRASAVIHESVEAIVNGDRALFDALHVPGFVNDDRRYRRAGMELLTEGSEPVVGHSIRTATGMDDVALATRGDDLALHRNVYRGRRRDGFEYEVETLILGELADDGRLATTVVFDGSDLDAAYRELDRRYLALLARDGQSAARTWAAVCRFTDAFNQRDWAAHTTSVAREYTVEDHRPASFGAIDAATALQLAIEVVEISPDNRLRFASVALTSAGAVLALANPDAHVDYDTSSWMVFVVMDNVVARLEIFAPDDEPAARDRFAALGRSSGEGVPSNAAWEAVLRSYVAIERGDRAAFEALHAAAYRYDDRRAGVRTEGLGLRTVAGAEHLFEDAHRVKTPLAVRGERLTLHHALWRGRAADSTEWEFEVLSTTETDGDGRIASTVVFESADLDAAYEDFDRQYLDVLELERGPSQLTAAWRTVSRWIAGFNRRDWASLRALASSACLLHDHRPASYGLLEGDAFWDMLATFVDLTPGLGSRVVAVEALSEHAVLVRARIDGAEWHGTAYENSLWIVYAVGPGGMNALELFAIEEADAARDRFAALSAGTDMVEPNAAFRAISHATSALAEGDSAVFDELFDPGVRVDDRRRGVRSETAGFDLGHSQMVRHASHYELELLATRGERLSLHHGTYRGERDGGFGWEFDVLVVTRLTSGGRVGEVMYFDADDADAAYAELDTTYLGDLTAEALHLAPTFATISRWGDAFNSRDWSAQADVVADDFRLRDHRTASLGEAGRRDVRSLSEAYVDVTPDIRLRFVAVDRLHPRAALVRTTTEGATAGREAFESPALMVFVVEEGRVERLDLFPLEARGRAADHVDEFIADLAVPPEEGTGAQHDDGDRTQRSS
jgi:class 3 adenylate cyclase/ketosteroid isomerase-like protein/tetratricopeptide (TPR) repeat protein